MVDLGQKKVNSRSPFFILQHLLILSLFSFININFAPSISFWLIFRYLNHYIFLKHYSLHILAVTIT